jgi:hypothetical protein
MVVKEWERKEERGGTRRRTERIPRIEIERKGGDKSDAY